MNRLWTLIGSAGLLVLIGCRTIPPDSTAALASGIASARAQSQEAFRAVNDLVADTTLDFAADQPILRESSFEAGLDDDSLQAWDQILGELEKYAGHLQALTSPELAGKFDDEAVHLAGELNDFGQHLAQAGLEGKTPAIGFSIATSFTKLGELLIRIHARARARHAMTETDGELGRILRGMADSLGASQTNGVRGTVTAHWAQRMAEKKVAFLGASDHAAKRQIASDFRDMLGRRAAQDLVLISLRRSMLHLASLHHALAQGESWTARSATAAIADEIQRTRNLSSRINDKLKSE